MSIEERLEADVLKILDIARFAPSVHNTQPWQVKVAGSELHISIDKTHQLHDGDPTGRQTIISLGIFSEAICLAASSLGLKARSVTLQHNKQARIEFKTSDPEASEAIRLLKRRCSDRSVYKITDLSHENLLNLEGIQITPHVSVHVLIEPEIKAKVANLTSKGIRLALSSPGFRKELSQYLIPRFSSKKRGIDVKSLYLSTFLELLDPWLIRAGIGLNAEARLEKKRWLSASAIAVITSKGDMPIYWFEVGRTYLHVSLEIERQGLSQATSAAIVEASDFHEDVETLMGTSQRIQSIIRLGKGAKRRYQSPRVTAEQLLIT